MHQLLLFPHKSPKFRLSEKCTTKPPPCHSFTIIWRMIIPNTTLFVPYASLRPWAYFIPSTVFGQVLIIPNYCSNTILIQLQSSRACRWFWNDSGDCECRSSQEDSMLLMEPVGIVLVLVSGFRTCYSTPPTDIHRNHLQKSPIVAIAVKTP